MVERGYHGKKNGENGMNESYKNAGESRDSGFTMAAVAAAVAPKLSKTDVELRARHPEPERTEAPAGVPSTMKGNSAAAEGAATAMPADDYAALLFSPGEAKKLRTLWDTIQGGFVDEPREAVANADSLLSEVMRRLTEMFVDEKSKLDAQWERGDSVS